MRIKLTAFFCGMILILNAQNRYLVLIIDSLIKPDSYIFDYRPYVDSVSTLRYDTLLRGKESIDKSGEFSHYISSKFELADGKRIYLPISQNLDVIEIEVSNFLVSDTIRITKLVLFDKYVTDTTNTCIYYYKERDTGLVYLPKRTKCFDKIQKPDYKGQNTRLIINGKSYKVALPSEIKRGGYLISDGCGRKRKHIRFNVESRTKQYYGVFKVTL